MLIGTARPGEVSLSVSLPALYESAAYIERGRLSARVAALRPRLVILNAPAGFGKSYLAAEIAARYAHSAVVDCARAGDDIALARSIAEALDKPGLLVLENADPVFGYSRCVALIRHVLQTPYRRRSILICARGRVPAQIVAGTDAQEIVTFTEDDLRFTFPEMTQFVERFALSESQLRELDRITQRWPVALKLFERLLFDHDTGRALEHLQSLRSGVSADRAAQQPRIAVLFRRGIILVGGTEVELGRRQRELLFFLATDRRPKTTAAITDALWPDSDGDHAIGALRVLISRLRQTLGADVVESFSGGYRLAAHVRSDET